MRKLSGWQKIGVGTAIGAGLLAGGEALTQTDAPAAAKVKAVGELTLLADGVAMSRQIIGALGTKLYLQEQEANAKQWARLPQLEPGLTLALMSARYQDRWDKDAFYTGEGMSVVLTLNSYLRSLGREHDPQAVPVVLGMVARSVIQDRQDSIGLPTSSTAFKIDMERVIGACHVLDEIAPIMPECTRTPQTEDTGKYWYDFIDLQARTQLPEPIAA